MWLPCRPYCLRVAPLRCKGFGATPATAADNVGDVSGKVIEAAATLLFAAAATNFEVVTWQRLQNRLRAGQNRALMMDALNVLGKSNVLAEVEVAVPPEAAEAAADGDAEEQGRRVKRRRQPPPTLEMRQSVTLPISTVKRGGQDAFPNFKMKPVSEWHADAVLDAIKQENGRSDSKRQKSSRG